MVTQLRIEDFDYILPQERIPLHPLQKRDDCKLLVRSPNKKLYHKKFHDLPGLMPVGSLIVCNDTRVINARLTFQKETGAEIEIFLLEPTEPSDYALSFQSDSNCQWKCLVGNSKKWKEGKIRAALRTSTGDEVEVFAERISTNGGDSSEIRFNWSDKSLTFGKIIECTGKIPIPPYLNRDSELADNDDYQTVYAEVKGSVAAPTAGLHFTPAVFEDLEAHNIKVRKLTLHVGAGTFRPVKSDTIGGHSMHAEPFTVTKGLILDLIEWKKKGKPIIAVGTTSVRTLESLPYIGHALQIKASNPYFVEQWSPYREENDFDTLSALEAIIRHLEEQKTSSLIASTSIIIAPGFKWRITDGIVTNFHQPKSTLLLLVSSFLGGDEWRDVYSEALQKDYRFLSYGDASLLLNR